MTLVFPPAIIHGPIMTASSSLPDFAISASPSNITDGQVISASVNVTILLRSLNGFVGNVNLSSSRPSGLATGPGARALNLTPGSIATTQLYYDTGFVPAGTYDVVITGSSDQLSHSTTVRITVHYSEFELTANPDTFLMQPGETRNATRVTITGIGKYFGGTIDLGNSGDNPQLAEVFIPHILPVPPANMTETAELSVSVSAYIQPGNYGITVFADVNGGFFPHYLPLHLKVGGSNTTTAPPGVRRNDWAKYDNVDSYWHASNQSITPVDLLAYYQNAYSVKLAIVQTNGSTVSAIKTTSYLNMTTDTLSNTGDLQDTSQPLFPWIIAPNLNGSQFNRTMTSQYAGAMRHVNVLNLTATTSYSQVQAVWIWDAASGILVEENWKITAAGPGGTIYGTLHIRISETNIWPVQLPEYAVTVPASTVAVRTGGDIAVTVTSLNGYSDSIYITALALPNTLIPNAFNPNTTRLAPNQNVTLSMTPTIPSSGSLRILIAVSGGGIVHKTLVTVIPSDLTYTIGPQDIQVIVGQSVQAAIIVNSPTGLRIPVRLSIPQNIGGASLQKNNTELSISNPQLNGPGLSILTIRPLAIGTYTVYVNVDTPGTHDTLSISVKAVDFRIDLTPNLAISPPGSTFTQRVQITPINGFAKTVKLTAQTSAGLAVTVRPDQVRGDGDFTLTLGPSQPGNYTITLTATSGSATHNAVMRVQVLPRSLSSSSILQPYGLMIVLGLTAGLILAAVAVVTVLLVQKRSRPTGPSSQPIPLTGPAKS